MSVWRVLVALPWFRLHYTLSGKASKLRRILSFVHCTIISIFAKPKVPPSVRSARCEMHGVVRVLCGRRPAKSGDAECN